MNERTKPLVLCIEDEEDFRELLAIQLEKDFELLFANDGREGVRLAIYHRPNLILMDLMMPNINGVEASEMIKSIKGLQNSPVVVLTAAPREVRELAVKAGCDMVIEKPAQNLAQRLHAMLAESNLQEA